jgi:hypothetical protein
MTDQQTLWYADAEKLRMTAEHIVSNLPEGLYTPLHGALTTNADDEGVRAAFDKLCEQLGIALANFERGALFAKYVLKALKENGNGDEEHKPKEAVAPEPPAPKRAEERLVAQAAKPQIAPRPTMRAPSNEPTQDWRGEGWYELYERMAETIHRAQIYASSFGTGKLPKDVVIARIMFAMLLGRELGVPPMAAVGAISFIGDKPVMSGAFMLAIIRARGCRVEILENTDKAAHVRITNPEGDKAEVRWTIEQAHKAGIAKGFAWERFPRNMLLWRAVAEGVRMVASHLLGGLPVYTAEELADENTPIGEDGGLA